ncbi:hypothetical protein MGP2080_04235 [marine gamma proteobacterium HTCC2080]|nr:hypothetical protein MGP2080_04235 [marine gamma proteobacterium HTCC2080]
MRCIGARFAPVMGEISAVARDPIFASNRNIADLLRA